MAMRAYWPDRFTLNEIRSLAASLESQPCKPSNATAELGNHERFLASGVGTGHGAFQDYIRLHDRKACPIDVAVRLAPSD
jgi:hypothetical protein